LIFSSLKAALGLRSRASKAGETSTRAIRWLGSDTLVWFSYYISYCYIGISKSSSVKLQTFTPGRFR
jgi:hypothetical protein